MRCFLVDDNGLVLVSLLRQNCLVGLGLVAPLRGLDLLFQWPGSLLLMPGCLELLPYFLGDVCLFRS